VSEDEEELPSLQPTIDAADPRTATRVRTELDMREREAEQFWEGVFSSKTGRREMWGILVQAHPFEAKFPVAPNGTPDAMATFMRLGEQQFGLNLFLMWQMRDPEAARLMLEENDTRFTAPLAALKKPRRKKAG
jgi:hypothetical protein